jgi:hypothetical protein
VAGGYRAYNLADFVTYKILGGGHMLQMEIKKIKIENENDLAEQAKSLNSQVVEYLRQ